MVATLVPSWAVAPMTEADAAWFVVSPDRILYLPEGGRVRVLTAGKRFRSTRQLCAEGLGEGWVATCSAPWWAWRPWHVG